MHSPGQAAPLSRPAARAPCACCAPQRLLRASRAQRPYLASCRGLVTVLQYSPCPAAVTIQSIVLRYKFSPASLLQYNPAIQLLFSTIQTIVLQYNPSPSKLPRLQYNFYHCNTKPVITIQFFLLGWQYNFFFHNIIWALAQNGSAQQKLFFSFFFSFVPEHWKIPKIDSSIFFFYICY